MRRQAVGVLAALLAGAVVAGCTAVPRSSEPQVVRSIGVAGDVPPVNVTPPFGANPRSIVEGFLANNAATNDPNHSAARSYLTTEQKGRWSDSTITVVDRTVVGNAVDGKISVTGQEIGTVDDAGVYTPALRGDGTGTGGVPVSQSFGMRRVNGQWRIESLQKGLLLSVAQFQRYQQRVVYFFDVSESRLVPDPRYTQLVDPVDLATWLVARLAQGPGGGLQTGLPDQTDPKRVQVVFPGPGLTNAPVRIEIPGAGQLDTVNLDRLGAQIANTLSQVPQVDSIEITDGGQPVRIPAVGGSRYTFEQIAGQFQPALPESRLFYLRDGAVFDQSGRRLPGRVGAGAYGLTSAALTTDPTGTLRVAGVRGSGSREQLDVGTVDRLVATRVKGTLSRPTWAPGADEVWIGSGPDVLRVSPTGVVRTVPVDVVGGKATGTVAAVRLSPEGARVAIVLTAPDGSSQLYVGSVVRTSGKVRVDALTPISPQGIAVTDAAWNDQLKLFTIGRDLRTGSAGVYEVQCDGSLWTARNSIGLPQAPDSVTVTAKSVAVVSTGGTVWRQQAAAWAGVQGDETRGTNPVYLE